MHHNRKAVPRTCRRAQDATLHRRLSAMPPSLRAFWWRAGRFVRTFTSTQELCVCAVVAVAASSSMRQLHLIARCRGGCSCRPLRSPLGHAAARKSVVPWPKAPPLRTCMAMRRYVCSAHASHRSAVWKRAVHVHGAILESCMHAKSCPQTPPARAPPLHRHAGACQCASGVRMHCVTAGALAGVAHAADAAWWTGTRERA